MLGYAAEVRARRNGRTIFEEPKQRGQLRREVIGPLLVHAPLAALGALGALHDGRRHAWPVSTVSPRPAWFGCSGPGGPTESRSTTGSIADNLSPRCGPAAGRGMTSWAERVQPLRAARSARSRSPTGQPAQPEPQHRFGMEGAAEASDSGRMGPRRGAPDARTRPGWGRPRSEPTVRRPAIGAS